MKLGDLVRFSSRWKLVRRINAIPSPGIIVGTQEFVGLDSVIVTYRYKVKWACKKRDEREWFDGEELEVIVDEGR